MLAHSIKKSDFELVSDKVNEPVYGGYDEIKHRIKPLSDLPRKSSLETRTRLNAIQHIKSGNLNNSRALIELGDIHFQNESFKKASQYYIRGLKQDTTNVSIYKKLIHSLVARNEFAKADIFFNQLLEVVHFHPIHLTDYLAFRITASVHDSTLVDETRHIFNQYRNSNNDSILNLVGLYEILINNDFKSGKSILKLALGINSHNVHANNNIGICYRHTGETQKAIKYLQKAHFLDLRYQSAYENLASIYNMQGELDKAIAILENAEANHVELSVEWRHNLAMFYMQNAQYNLAIAKYENLLKTEATNSLILNNIGFAYEKLEQSSEAKKYFESAVDRVKLNLKEKIPVDERAAASFNNLVRYLARESNIEQALHLIKQANSLFPKNFIAYHQEGILRIRGKEYDLAKEKFRKVLSINPNFVDARVNLSFLLEDIDLNYIEAIELIKDIPQDNANQDTITIKTIENNLAFAYLKLGDLKEAKKHLREDDDSYASYATKGLYHLLLDDLEESEAYYQKSFNKAKPEELDRAKQFYHFERMEYWRRTGDTVKAIESAKMANDFKVSHHISKIVASYLRDQSFISV